jgi:hypothetical protein
LFKKTVCILLLLLALSSQVYADVFLLEPTETILEDGEETDLGNVAAGETFKFVIQKKTGLGSEWNSLNVDSQTIPTDWIAESGSTDKTLFVFVTLPAAAAESVQRITFSVGDGTGPFSSQSISAYVTVKENLLDASIDRLKQDAMVSEESEFKLLINNESIAKHSVRISSDLPEYWFKPFVVDVAPLQTLEVDLLVHPKRYGARQFSFTVSSELNSFEKSFDAGLNVFSTLRGKFSSPVSGFPFFTPSLLPHFLVNAFIALLS